MSLFAELQRRSVFKVAAAYLVVGWLLIQVAATVAPQLDLPAWAPRLITLLVALGFPVALLLAWAFELTPEGVKVDASGVGSKRVFVIAAAFAALALGWYLRAPSDGDPVQGGQGSAADARSIAVLPFVNMSGDAENEYFSDGISEEILNSLAQMPDVKVAARTSSFSFKGHTKEIPDIARELEVRMVLEGSVRKQGERVRITAQLIDASKGFHVWSQTYDRDLKDIFAIQDEIAHAIANELQVKLTAAHDDGKADTADLVAYDEYLKGMQLWQARGEPGLREAARLFRSAVTRDPDFAKGWAGVALTWLVLPEWTDEPLAPAWATARDAAEHAAALDPSLPEPHAVLGYIAMAEGRVATGRALFARSHALAPSYATAWQWDGEGSWLVGDHERSVQASRRGAQLDPKAAILRQAHANSLWAQGRFDEANAVCEKVLVDHPGWVNCVMVKFDTAVVRKDAATARALLLELATPRGPDAVRLAERVADALAGKGDREAALRAQVAAPDGTLDPSSISPLADGDVILVAIALGRPELAVPRVRALHGRVPYLMRATLHDRSFWPLLCVAEVAALAGGLGIDAAISAARCEESKQPRRAPMAPPKKS